MSQIGGTSSLAAEPDEPSHAGGGRAAREGAIVQAAADETIFEHGARSAIEPVEQLVGWLFGPALGQQDCIAAPGKQPGQILSPTLLALAGVAVEAHTQRHAQLMLNN